MRVQFHHDLSGDIASITIPIEPNVEPTSFARQAPAEMRERKFLDALAGEYDNGGVPVSIVVREDNAAAIQRARNRARPDSDSRHLFPRRRT